MTFSYSRKKSSYTFLQKRRKIRCSYTRKNKKEVELTQGKKVRTEGRKISSSYTRKK
jgi:hypothetical protein